MLTLLRADELPSNPSQWDRNRVQEETRSALVRSGINLDAALHQEEWEDIWAGTENLTEAIARSTALYHEPTRQQLETNRSPESVPPLDPFLQANISLFVADSLIAQQQLDAAAQILASAPTTSIVEPARYHFLLGSALFSLGKLEDAKRSWQELRRLGPIPKRYASLAENIERTIDQAEPDSLETIARDMRDVRRRLDLGEVDTQVRRIEDDVVKRLDLMIQKIENKKETSSPTSQPSQPNAPADESRLAGAQGEGNVDAKRLGDRRAWGNLPAKEREKTLQEIGRDLPGPYRSAVEEYFRQLARPKAGDRLP
jgi:tetratricopeptide (TPR) repeat protein